MAHRSRAGLLDGITKQARSIGLFLLLLYAPAVLILLAITVACHATGFTATQFMRDPTAFSDAHPLTGMASNAGILHWCATATVCLFSWLVLHRREPRPTVSKFFLFWGLLTTSLALDDLFLLHEAIIPDCIGVGEKPIFVVYAAATVVGGIAFRRYILKTDYLLLFAALGFFALSLCVDAIQHDLEPIMGHWRSFLEDGAKLLGVAAWFGYFLRCGLAEVARPSISRSRA